MYETGRRAYRAQPALCRLQNLDWYCRLPDNRECEKYPPLPDLSDDALSSESPSEAWFQIKTRFGFQHPSVVLVEKVFHRNDIVEEIQNCPDRGYWKQKHVTKTNKKSEFYPGHYEQKHFSPPTDKAELAQKDPDCATTTRHNDLKSQRTSTIDVGDGKRRHSLSWAKKKRSKLTTESSEDKVTAKAEWRHNDAAMFTADGAMMNIDEGLQKDAIGCIPRVSSFLSVIRRMELDTEGFFAFLFSARWKEGCLLRVLRGKLLDSLVDALDQMQRVHEVICHSTMAYTYFHKPLVPCNTTPAANKISDVIKEKILVELDCFHPQRRPETDRDQSHTSDLSQAVGQSSDTSDLSQAVRQSSNTSDLSHAARRRSSWSDPSKAVRQQSRTFDSLQVVRQSTDTSDTSEAATQQRSTSDSLQAVRQHSSKHDLSEANGHQSQADRWPSHMMKIPVVEQQSHLLNSSKSSPQNISVLGHCRTPGVMCNIRGFLRPPPHSNCFSPYHVVREPHMLRRLREQSAFSQHSLPPLCTTAPQEPQRKKSTVSHSGDFCGPRLVDDTETIADGAFLTPVSQMSDHSLRFSKFHLLEIGKESPEKPKKNKTKKKNKGAKSGTSDEEDGDEQEDTQLRLHVDPSRVERFEKELEQMDTELVAKELVMPVRQRMRLQTRLKRELRIKYQARHELHESFEDISRKDARDKRFKDMSKKDKRLKDTSKRDERLKGFSKRDETLEDTSKKETDVNLLEQLTVGELTKQSAHGSSSPTQKLSTEPTPFMKQWPQCPNFWEFLEYLESEQRKTREKENAKRAAKKAKKKTLPQRKSDIKDGLSLAKTAKKAKKKAKNADVKPKEDGSVAGSSTFSQSKGGGKKKKERERKDGSQTQEQETRSGQGSAEKDFGSRKDQQIQEIDDPPYVYLSDSEVPDDITQSDLFHLVQLNRNFNPQKLKSSYSFERMFAHCSKQVPNYKKLLNFFSKPFKPKPKYTDKRKGAKSKRGKAKLQQSAQKGGTDAEMALQSPVHEPSHPPLVVIGKLRDFKFLQHKNYIPNPVTTPGILASHSLTDICKLLALAMQKFVVRKERTTSYGSYRSTSKVSVTFSKRAQQNSWLGIPPLKNACISRTNLDTHLMFSEGVGAEHNETRNR